jgi:hypothetical protein
MKFKNTSQSEYPENLFLRQSSKALEEIKQDTKIILLTSRAARIFFVNIIVSKKKHFPFNVHF